MLWVFIAFPLAAQEPRTKPPRLLPPSLLSRQVTVDSGGAGDFTTLSAALAFLATQPRTDLSRWLVQLYPGVPAGGGLSQYEEISVSIPSFTTVEGVVGGWTNGKVLGDIPTIRLLGTSGSLVTADEGAVILNVDWFDNTPTTAPVKIFSAVGSVVTTNMSVRVAPTVTNANAIDMVSIENNGSLSANNLNITRTDANTKTRAIVAQVGSQGAAIYGGRLRSGLGSPALVENLAASTFQLFGTRLEGGAEYDIKRSGTGSVITQGISYASDSGNVSNGVLRGDAIIVAKACQIKAGLGSPEGLQASNPCDLWQRSDGPPYLYVKVSGTTGNGWAAVGTTVTTNRPASCVATEQFYATATNEFCTCIANNTARCATFN
ncbi:MAG TPA: hypothetical protein VGS07_32255 [Thermoanaerobaculia bacterium]|jgi:hypothetical protein|nr:hypothetical protein [Thermoanaerobaculia bacterium]